MRVSCAHSSATVLHCANGRVAELLNAPVLKTGRDASLSWVRIPPLPPTSLELVHRLSGLRIKHKQIRVLHAIPGESVPIGRTTCASFGSIPPHFLRWSNAPWT